MKHTVKTKVLFVVCVVIVLALFLRTFSFPDLFQMFYAANYFPPGNVYSLVRQNLPICVWLDSTYPPLFYFTVGPYLHYLQIANLMPSSLFTQSACPVWELLSSKTYLFWGKLLFLIFHLGSAAAFSKLFEKNRYVWFLIWLLNPIAIFVSFFQGQFEIIPVFFILLSILFAKQRRIFWSVLALGVGGAYKHFPFLLLPVYLISLTPDWRKRIVLVIVSLLPYLSVLPVFFNQDYLYKMTSFNENTKMLSAGIVLGNTRVSYYLLLYAAIIIYTFVSKAAPVAKLIRSGFLLTAIYFLTAPDWFVQRFLFLMPWMLLIASRRQIFMFLMPVVSMVFFIYTFVTFPGLFDHRLLLPIQPGVFQLPDILTQMDIVVTPLLKSYTTTAFNILLITLGILALRERTQELQPKYSTVVISTVPLVLYLFFIFTSAKIL